MLGMGTGHIIIAVTETMVEENKLYNDHMSIICSTFNDFFYWLEEDTKR